MADGHTPSHVQCLECWVREQAAPPEAQMRILAREDWLSETAAFIPRAMNQDQAVAAEMLTAALTRYVRAFGVSMAAPRIATMLMVLREQATRQMIMARILEARKAINARARACYARGDIGGAHEIEAEPTPDYPGKDRDDAWLSQEQERGAAA